MKKYENLIQAMKTFRDSYHVLLTEISDYERTTGESVNDVPGFNEYYPLDMSFDEFPIDQWVNHVVDQIEKTERNFKVLNYEYLNTGGNTMVGIFTVWLPALKQTVYALTNDDGCSLSVVDYISNDIEIYDYDEVTIDRCDFDTLYDSNEYFELYRYCFNEYTKSDSSYFGYVRAVPYHLLSDELQSKVDADYLTWLDKNNNGCVPTDGVTIIVCPDYEMLFKDHHEDDEDLLAVKEWKSWHDGLINKNTTDEELEAFYGKKYRMYFNGKRVHLPFNADTFNKINDLLDSVIREW